MKKLLLGAMAAGSLACWPVTSCIARGSKVRTPRGPRPIEELGVGDEVFCVEPDSGELIAAKLSGTRSARRECVELSFAGGSLVVTSDHPLWCPQSRQWAPAGDWALEKRTHLLRVSDERVEAIAVQRVSTFVGVHEVFDLSVDHPLHNFVANEILVHNKEPLPRACTAGDGGQVREFDACTCVDGSEGMITCDASLAVCSSCEETGSDGGVDGGSGDGGVGDAGP